MSIDLATIHLAYGAHDDRADGVCLLEAVAWFAGERHSDHPQCVCPVLGAFGRAWNDTLPDEDRDRLLKPFIPRLVDTRSSADVQDRRAFLAADWAVRVFTPAWLRKAGLAEDADHIEHLPALTTVELCHAAMPVITTARRSAAAARATARAAAGDAAGAAAGAAAGVAAWVAAGAAAGAAARGAARAAAWAAARDAAGAAARVAARDAARAAAGAALQPIVVELQASAADLFDRMIRLGEVA